MKKEAMLLLVAMIVLFPLVEASFNVSNYNIETTYGPKQNIVGEIEISFSNEPSDSLIDASSDFSGSISLVDFLDANGASYDCFPEDCEDDYSAANPKDSKSFSLGLNEKKILGLKLSGNIKEVSSLSFDVSVNSPPSCKNPLEIDILDDDDTEWSSDVIGNNFACEVGGGTGCFNKNESLKDVSIGETPFCEKISIPASEKFKLGAWVKKGTTKWYNGLLVMTLYDLDTTELISCELPEPTASEISCDVEYKNEKEQEYYVCINADEITDYIIKTENKNSCGFYAFPGEETEYNDYYITAKGARYENVGSFTYNEDKYLEQTDLKGLADYIDSYLDWRYDKNCTGGCIIPLMFKSYANLNINVSNLNLRYSTGAGPIATPETKIYDIEKIPYKISSDFQVLDLEKTGIKTPSKYDEHDLMLYLDGEELLEEDEKIEVKKVPIIAGVFPNMVPAGYPTKFSAVTKTPSGKNITEYKWAFGDETNETEKTATNFVTYAYADIREYSLTLEVKDEAGFSAKRTFTIYAENPKKIVNLTITKYKKNLENITLQLTSMPDWYEKEVLKIIDVELLKEEIKAIERDYGLASTSDEYVKIMAELLEIEVPYSIKEINLGALPFFVDVDMINPEYFDELGAGSLNASEEEMQIEIAGWTQDVLDVTLNFKYISAYYDDRIENLLSVFDLKINSEKQLGELYVVIEEIDIVFGRDYKTKEFSDGFSTGIILTNVLKDNVEFAVPFIDVEDIVIYLSPGFSELGIVGIKPCDFDGICEEDEDENTENCRSDCKPYGTASVLFIVLLLLAIISYILLQWWYKTKYERHLFKNRNDLYNIVNFIKNAENQGMNDSDIRNRLKKAGWNGEQVSYAFKKIRGQAIMAFDFLKLFSRFQRKKLETQVSRGYVPKTLG